MNRDSDLPPSTPSGAPRSGAAGPGPFAALEQEIAREINFARTRPAEYADILEGLRPFYNGREFRQPGKPSFLTEEGVAALDEAVRYLRSLKPMGPLETSPGMCLGAGELVKDQAGSDRTGHRGTDGSFCEQRVERFGSWSGSIGENLSYGTDTGRGHVISLLIDDGVASRGHRRSLLDPAFRVIGVACGDHQFGAVCVVTLAGGFTRKPDGPAATRKL